MDSKKAAENERLCYWAQIMRDCEESGLTKKEFCQKAGIKPSRFYYWQRKLRDQQEAGRETDTTVASDTLNIEEDNHSFTPVGFTEVVITSPVKRTVLSQEPVSPGVIYIDVPGANIRADQNYPPVKLAELLRELLYLC